MSEKFNPFIVQAPKQFAQVPIGFYTSKFKGIEDYALQSGEIKWRFSWEITTGPQTGNVATALCDRKLNVKTLAGTLIGGLLGRGIVEKEDVKAAIDGCKDMTYLISIAHGPQGGKPGVRSCGQPPAM